MSVFAIHVNPQRYILLLCQLSAPFSHLSAAMSLHHKHRVINLASLTFICHNILCTTENLAENFNHQFWQMVCENKTKPEFILCSINLLLFIYLFFCSLYDLCLNA